MHVGFEMLIAVYVCSWTKRRTIPPGQKVTGGPGEFFLKKQYPRKKKESVGLRGDLEAPSRHI